MPTQSFLSQDLPIANHRANLDRELLKVLQALKFAKNFQAEGLILHACTEFFRLNWHYIKDI